MPDHGPGDPGKFAGKGDHGDVHVGAREQAAQPVPEGCRRILQAQQRRTGTVDQLPSQILVAPLADAQELGLSAGRELSWDQTQPGRQIGLMTPDDPALAERLSKLRLRRGEIAADIKRAEALGTGKAAKLDKATLSKLCAEMRRRLAEGPPELRQAYMKLFLEKAELDGDRIKVCGSKALLAKFVETGGAFNAPAVLAYVREWRARRDSNS